MSLLLRLLQRAIEKEASDIHLKTDAPPYFRVHGELLQRKRKLSQDDIDTILAELLSEAQREALDTRGDTDLAYYDPQIGRFRVNVFRQRGSVSIVMRRIKADIPSFDALHLPSAVDRFAKMQRGLVLITGTTGSGKSTSLAAIIDNINRTRKCHIITIEDPIEYTHKDNAAVVNQREILIDTEGYASALRAAMRQDPDVILVGEMRDLETFQAAISASETGHLVFSTLHTTNAMQTVDRIIDLFPTDQQVQIRSQLSMNLRAIMCQRLLPTSDGKGRVPACEVLLNTAAVQKIIKENRLSKIPICIQQGREDGMQSFNDSLFALIKAKFITVETAMEASDAPEELTLMLQGIQLGQMRGGILSKAGDK